MDNSGEGNRFAPPLAAVADVAASAESGLLASRWRRLGGAVIDGTLLMILIWILSLITPWRPFEADPQDNPFTRFELLNLVFSFLVFLAVNGFLLATRGQTVAKVMLGMRIVRPDGSLPDVGRLVLRYGVGYVLGIFSGLGMIYSLIDSALIFRANRRCLHDEIAGTMVVRV